MSDPEYRHTIIVDHENRSANVDGDTVEPVDYVAVSSYATVRTDGDRTIVTGVLDDVDMGTYQ